MSWNITFHDHVILLEMNSNKANVMNFNFFQDIHHAFDLIEKQHPHKSVVVTGTGSIFSAGLDLNDCYPRFASKNISVVRDWFHTFREAVLRLFKFKSPIIGAINGHAFAGGLILSLFPDYRFVAQGNFKFSLNEVPIGMPMPSTFSEIIKNALGSSSFAEEAILSGKIYSVEEAVALRFFHKSVPAVDLVNEALNFAKAIHPDTIRAYETTKMIMRHDLYKKIEGECQSLDESFIHLMCTDDSLRALNKAIDKMNIRK